MKTVFLLMLIITFLVCGYFLVFRFDHKINTVSAVPKILIISDKKMKIHNENIFVSSDIHSLNDNYLYLILHHSNDSDNLTDYSKGMKLNKNIKVYSNCNDQDNIGLYHKLDIDVIHSDDELYHLLENI